MDRSFLSRAEVIASSRNFVCIRLASYEDETEKAFVSQFVRGDVANTAFAILSPDAKPAMRGRGPGRGPRDFFADPSEMAASMDKLARKYEAGKVAGVASLPIALSPKIGLAIAAADQQPLVLVLAGSNSGRAELESKVSKLAWENRFLGRFVYASADSIKGLTKIQGQSIQEGVLVIEPDIFGVGGKVVHQLSADSVEAGLPEALGKTLKEHVRYQKNRRLLAELGFDEGVYYETGIAVSGKGEAADRARYKKRLDLKKSQ